MDLNSPNPVEPMPANPQQSPVIDNQNGPTNLAQPTSGVLDSIPPDFKTPEPPSPPPVPQPTVATVFHTDGVSEVPKPPQKRKFGKLKLPLVIALIVVVLGGGVSAGYFGYVVPNKPQNIWGTSLTNMGKGIDHLIDYSSDLQKTTKGINIKGSYTAKGDFAGSGTIDSSTYNADASFKAGITLSSGTLSLELRSIAVPNAKFPDLYFKVGGLKTIKSLNDSAYSTIIQALDDQWISVDHAYLDGLAGQDSKGVSYSVSTQDVLDFERAFNGVNKDWLFTTNKQHSVLEIKQNVGKEKQDGRNVYHYKVSINKDHLKSYAKALRDKLKDTKFGKAYATDMTSISDDQINKEVDAMDLSKNFDLWADTHTKLVHKIRIGDPDNYTEFSQDYQGGSKYPFGVKYYYKSGKYESTTTTSLVLDSKTNAGDMKLNYSDSSKNSVDVNLTISQNATQTKVDKPSGSKSIQEIMKSIFGVDLSTPTVAASSSKDVERQTDLKAVASHLEVYNAQKGFYPTLANLNDSAWVATNLVGLDKQALKDPEGTVYTMASSPAAKMYSYAPTDDSGKSCNNTTANCTKFVLTATLSDGSKFTLNSLN